MNTQTATLNIDGSVPAREPMESVVLDGTDNMTLRGRTETEAPDPLAPQLPTTNAILDGVRVPNFVSEKFNVCTTRKDGSPCNGYLVAHPHYLADLADSYAYIMSDATDFDINEDDVKTATDSMSALTIIESNSGGDNYGDIFAANRYYSELTRISNLLYRAASAEFEANAMIVRDSIAGNNPDTLADRSEAYTKKIGFMERAQKGAYLGYKVIESLWPEHLKAINWAGRIKSAAFDEGSRLRDLIKKPATKGELDAAQTARVDMAKKLLRRAA